MNDPILYPYRHHQFFKKFNYQAVLSLLECFFGIEDLVKEVLEYIELLSRLQVTFLSDHSSFQYLCNRDMYITQLKDVHPTIEYLFDHYDMYNEDTYENQITLQKKFKKLVRYIERSNFLSITEFSSDGRVEMFVEEDYEHQHVLYFSMYYDFKQNDDIRDFLYPFEFWLLNSIFAKKDLDRDIR